jgi:hypothetical protein
MAPEKPVCGASTGLELLECQCDCGGCWSRRTARQLALLPPSLAGRLLQVVRWNRMSLRENVGSPKRRQASLRHAEFEHVYTSTLFTE